MQLKTYTGPLLLAWPKKLKKKKATSYKLQAPSLTACPGDDRISYYERNKL